MIDFEGMQKELHEKSLAVCKENNKIIDEQIRKVMTEYNCTPSDIQLVVKPYLTYEILVKVSRFTIENYFEVTGND